MQKHSPGKKTNFLFTIEHLIPAVFNDLQTKLKHLGWVILLYAIR